MIGHAKASPALALYALGERISAGRLPACLRIEVQPNQSPFRNESTTRHGCLPGLAANRAAEIRFRVDLLGGDSRNKILEAVPHPARADRHDRKVSMARKRICRDAMLEARILRDRLWNADPEAVSPADDA
jgi:hypothetical protein